MTYLPPDDFLTKQEVKTAHGVSTRTVQRHISDLLKAGDQPGLSSLHLCTDGGECWPGPEVTAELIETLNRDGRKPRWYIDPFYAAAQFGTKSSDDVLPEASPERPTPTPSGTEDDAVVRARNRWLEEENASLKKQLVEDRESRKADRELQERNIELLQELLKFFKGDESLPDGMRPVIPAHAQSVEDAEVIPATESKPQGPTTVEPTAVLTKTPEKKVPTKSSRSTKKPASTKTKKGTPTKPNVNSTSARKRSTKKVPATSKQTRTATPTKRSAKNKQPKMTVKKPSTLGQRIAQFFR